MSKDISQAVPDAAAFDREFVGALQRAVTHTVTVTTQKARSEHRWQDRTGGTRASIEGEVSDTGNGAKGTIGAGENAARLNAGTPPHVIEAHERKAAGGRDASGRFQKGTTRPGALRFQVGGQTVFARRVNHPGTSPDPFLDAAADAAGEELALAVEHAIDEALGS